MTILAGQRVMTPLGPGTVLAFEAFDDRGRETTRSAIDNGNRAIVKLDHPENWWAPAHTPDPYIFRSQLSALVE